MNENLISELTDWVKPFFPEKYSIDIAHQLMRALDHTLE
jgi:hypothetical protein